MVKPPRALITRFPSGTVLGAPGDRAQQGRVLSAALALLAQPAPMDPVFLDERLD